MITKYSWLHRLVHGNHTFYFSLEPQMSLLDLAIHVGLMELQGTDEFNQIIVDNVAATVTCVMSQEFINKYVNPMVADTALFTAFTAFAPSTSGYDFSFSVADNKSYTVNYDVNQNPGYGHYQAILAPSS